MTKIKLFDPMISSEEEQCVKQVLRSGFWASGAGTGNVLKFENEFKKYIKCNECVAVNSGTAALNLALSLFDLKNSEIILPSLSFVSTAHAVILNNAKPVFADVDPKTLCLDIEDVKKKISKKTKAILPVHFAGMPCNLDKMSQICKNFNLKLIEDAAHASGTTYKKKKIGTHGHAVCFSFHPVKNLAMPTGGLICINGKKNKEFKQILKSKRWCGITDRKNSFYDVKEIGWNYYMNEFSAGIGRIQLKKLDKMNRIRKEIARKYEKNITEVKKIPFSKDCSYHIYWILVKNRKKFMEKMLEKGVETGIHYKPIHQMTMYKSTKKLPITDKISNQIVSIPIHPNLSQKDTDRIISLINKFA